MNTLTQIYVGIDISKNFFDVHLHPLDKAFKITNNAQGIKKLLTTLSKYHVQQVVFETSGGYGHLLLKELPAHGYKIWQVDPKRIKGFIISEGIHAKTDRIDAQMIALFAAQKQSRYEKVILTANEELLRALNKRRTDLVCNICQ